MAITAKELMQPPTFEGLGKYVRCRAANENWQATFTFEFFGGQMDIEVSGEEFANPPVVGSFFLVAGEVRRNPRNGTIILVATEKRLIGNDATALSEEQTQQYVGGVTIRGVGVVKEKRTVTVNRDTFLSSIMEWQGALHVFKGLTPEMYQRIPAPSKEVGRHTYVRFELTMMVREERNRTGQLQVQLIPALKSIQLETLGAGNTASPTANTAAGSGLSGKPASPTPAPGAKV